MSEDVIRNIYYIENCIYLMFYNTPLPEVRLDLDLSSELMFHLSLDQLRFEEDFQRDDVLALLFSGQVNVSELSFAQRSAYVEVVQGPVVTRSA